MLILSRRASESIMIGDDIKVTVASINRGEVGIVIKIPTISTAQHAAKVNKPIPVSDDMAVILLETRGNQARLGIKAPLTVPVYRQEIYDRIQAGKELT